MKLYLTVIGVAVTLISAINIFFQTAEWYYVIIAVVFSAVMQFALDGTLAIIINKMPDAWFDVDNRLYHVFEWEKRLYKKLNVRGWKDNVWELGGLGGFSKSKLLDPRNPDYIEKFVIECNKGVLTHRLSYPIGFLVMLTLKGITPFTIAIPVATVNVFLNILPTLALRYNTPKLTAILNRLRRNTAKRKAEQSTAISE